MKLVGGRAKREYGPWLSTASVDSLLKNNDGTRKPTTNAIVCGERSSDDRGFRLGEPVVHGGSKNWVSRDIQEKNKKNT